MTLFYCKTYARKAQKSNFAILKEYLATKTKKTIDFLIKRNKRVKVTQKAINLGLALNVLVLSSFSNLGYIFQIIPTFIFLLTLLMFVRELGIENYRHFKSASSLRKAIKKAKREFPADL